MGSEENYLKISINVILVTASSWEILEKQHLFKYINSGVFDKENKP